MLIFKLILGFFIAFLTTSINAASTTIVVPANATGGFGLCDGNLCAGTTDFVTGIAATGAGTITVSVIGGTVCTTSTACSSSGNGFYGEWGVNRMRRYSRRIQFQVALP